MLKLTNNDSQSDNLATPETQSKCYPRTNANKTSTYSSDLLSDLSDLLTQLAPCQLCITWTG